MKLYRIFNVTVTVLLSILFVLLGFLYFKISYLRLGESFYDLWQSAKFYFYSVFWIPNSTEITVKSFSEILTWEIFLPISFEGFKIDSARYFSLLISKENFTAFLSMLLKKSAEWGRILSIVIPNGIIIFKIVQKIYDSKNTKHNRDTIPLRLYKLIYRYTYSPIKWWVLSYVKFLKERRYIYTSWVIIWVLHLNLATVLVEFLAYYLYFSIVFKFDNTYVQIRKLFIDLQVFFRTVPVWIVFFLALYLFGRFRKRIANGRLRHFEARNCGFINELPIVSMTCGSMGKKKTTLITDMALSQEVMFRQKAFELLKKNDMRFPFFPWISFELDLKRAIEYHEVYNIATVKTWIEKKRQRYEKNGDPGKRLYGYDVISYGTKYDDGLKIWALFEVLSTYAQLYFIYVIQSSLIVANYSVRTDQRLIDTGNFPLWYNDFFPELTTDGGRHSHILDFDTLRLGKKVIENNPNIGSFEFGVVLISEVGKERGNVLDHKEIKRNNEETNQKNDLFNSWLKMCRHSATVDNFPFIKVFTDEQRPESWGADARDLCDIIHIVSAGPQRIALPFYTIEEMLSEVAFNRFINLYYGMRFKRGDNTLLVHLLKTVCSWLYKRNIRLYNQYGYSISHIEKERGTMDAKVEKKKYYVMNKKAYSRRFCTDCFSDYFNDLAKKTKIGINDYIEYKNEKATVEELKMQNSYFINALYKNASSN